ncbi:MAG: nucleoside deaminase [Sphingobacteriales bacterium]|nr:MAG: nucleoside deaminase [Sphingobacteriales bacterium]
MQKALQLAEQALAEDEIPIGAIIVAGGQKIIAKGYNQTERLHDVTAHAEMLALTSASENLGSKYLKDCALYVTIEPCPMCAAALAWSQIPTIIFGASDEKRGYSVFQPSLLHPKTIVRNGVLQEDCARLMKDFFKAKR